MWRLIFLSFSILGMVGCSIHPLPDDVTRLQTREIVHHIRCEARAAIKQAIIDYLRKGELNSFVDDMESGRLPLNALNAHLGELPTKVRDNIVKYEGAAITYDFTFDITEQDTIAADFNFINVLSSGAFSMPSHGSSDHQRQTVRLFRVNDTFEVLIGFPSNRCTEDGTPENLVYPVAGRIGLGEMVETFVDLNEYQHLTGAKAGDSVPTMTDTFKFQTTVSGSVTPQVTITPLNHLFRVAGASLELSGLRKDLHQVIVALSLPIPKAGAPVPVVKGFLGAPKAQPAQSTGAVERNNTAIDNAINRSIINRLGAPF